MKNSHYEVKIPPCVDASELAGVCDGPDFLGVWEQDGLISLFWQGTGEAALNHVNKALKVLGVDLAKESMALLSVEEQDWNAQWAASVQPICVGRRFFIRPSWNPMNLPEDAIELVLDPKQAFGTGHHPTTQLLLEWLEEVNWHTGDRVLDVGTGSGILCMGALRLGASFALGIDNDATAIACAREYAMMNGFQGNLEFIHGLMGNLPNQLFDVILANLDRRTLLQLCKEFSRFRSSRTSLLLSGVLDEDEPDIIQTFQAQRWIFQGLKRKGEWAILHFCMSPVPILT